MVMVVMPPHENASSESSPVLVRGEGVEETFRTNADSVGISPKTNTAHDEWVSVDSNSVPSPEKVMKDMAQSSTEKPGLSFDSADDAMSRAVTEVAGNIDDEDDLDDRIPLTEAQLHTTVFGGEPVSLRLDVEFLFGLISNELHPDAEKYMKGVSTIAKNLFAENRPAGTSGHAIYNADFPPFLRSSKRTFPLSPLLVMKMQSDSSFVARCPCS